MVESWDSSLLDSFSIASSDTDAFGNPVVLASQTLASRLVAGGHYNMSVTGVYSGGSLSLDAVLKEGNTVLASVHALETSPKAGDYFGLSESTGWGSSAQTSYDNFSITGVPEPTSLAVVGLAAAGLMHRRRSHS
jgi:hypothetical protein